MTLLTTSVNVFKTAIIKTGVGALVVGLGYLVAKLFETKEAIGEVFNQQKFLNDAQKEAKEDMEAVRQSTSALIQHKKELNKLTDEEGNLLNKSEQAQAIYNKRLKLYKKELANVNKVNKEYNQTLLTEKSSLEDIADATDILISKMKDRMLQESFASLSKEFLDQAVTASLIAAEFDEKFRGRVAGNFAGVFEQSIDDVIKNIREKDFTKTFDEINLYTTQNKPEVRAMALLNTLLKEHDMALDDFAEAVKGGYYEEKTSKIADELQKQMSSGASIFGEAPDTGDKKEDKGLEGIALKRAKELERHNKLLLEIRHKYRNDDDRLKLNELLAEKRHLKEMKKLLKEEEGKETDTTKIDLKRQQNL